MRQLVRVRVVKAEPFAGSVVELVGDAVAGEGFGYTVVNIGALPIMVGAAFKLEQLTEDGWERGRRKRV